MACSGVPDICEECCERHDLDYVTQHISRAEADANFRRCIFECLSGGPPYFPANRDSWSKRLFVKFAESLGPHQAATLAWLFVRAIGWIPWYWERFQQWRCGR